MSVMDSIQQTLTTLAADQDYPMSGGVYYGVCNATSLDEWNYFVFNRTEDIPTNHAGFTCQYEVHIIHEDYVMEDYMLTVAKALKAAVPGLSLAGNIRYDYSTKGDTQVIVEICTLTFKKARKVDV